MVKKKNKKAIEIANEIANLIVKSKVENKKPDISYIFEEYELNDIEKNAVNTYNKRIDDFMDYCMDLVPKEDSYVKGGRFTKKALKIVTLGSLFFGAGIGIKLSKKVLGTALVTLGGTLAMRRIEQKYHTLTDYLEKHPGVLGWASIMDVNNARKNLERVIEYESKKV
jgi:hypothetical protein